MCCILRNARNGAPEIEDAARERSSPDFCRVSDVHAPTTKGRSLPYGVSDVSSATLGSNQNLERCINKKQVDPRTCRLHGQYISLIVIVFSDVPTQPLISKA